jgi:hypothetical protein
MNEITYKVNILYGHSELKQEYRYEKGKIICKGIRIDRDREGNIVNRTEEDLSSIGYPDRPMTENEANELLRFTK